MTQSDTSSRQAVIFMVGCVGLSWLIWVPLVLAYRAGADEVGDLTPLVLGMWLLGSWVPSLFGIFLAARDGGRSAVMALLARSLSGWRKSDNWLIPVALPALIWFTTILAVVLITEAVWPAIDPSRWVLIPLAVILALPFGPLGEEFGWRGYLQPRLLKRYSPVAAGTLIGIIWTVWHLPLFWAPAGTSISGSEVTLTAVASYTVTLIALSIVLACLAGPTRASLLPALLLHAVWNAEPARFLFTPLEDSMDPLIAGYLPVVTLVSSVLAIYLISLRRRDKPGEVI